MEFVTKCLFPRLFVAAIAELQVWLDAGGVNQKTLSHGEFHQLIYDIRKGEPEVRPLLSTSPESIDCVSELLKNSVEKQGTTFSEPISVEECLGATLLFTKTTWRYGQQSYPLILLSFIL